MASDLKAEDVVLTYTLNNVRPVEASDLALSLFALEQQYRRFATSHAETPLDDYRLYVRAVRRGSIVIDMINYATQPEFMAPFAPLLIGYAQELGDWFEFFKGIKDAREVEKLFTGKTQEDLQDISHIVRPAAMDSHSNINITAARGSVVLINSSIDSAKASAGQHILRRASEHFPSSKTGIHRDQGLYWYQIHQDRTTKPGDKAIIERIWPNPVKVRVASDDIKREMLDSAGNPFKRFYIVDVDVTESQGRPVLYRILDVKDSFDRDETAA
jgi:hypothetical protein